MTIPSERTRAIIYTQRFLRALLDPKQTPRVPGEIRKWASRCLRHYPAQYEIEMIAAAAPKLLDASSLPKDSC